VNSSTQSPWIEVTFTEALDFYARQLRHANSIANDQKILNIDGRYATAVEFQNGSFLAVTAASSENYSVHRDDWGDYEGNAVPQFWVKDMGLRNN
jgi:hypothetical protein